MHALIPFPFGRIRPGGWIRDQMRRDLDGFVGHLDRIVPDLMNDPIYGSGRLHGRSAAKDLGNLKSGDAEGEEQYKWWNSETQSNWWDGYLRTVFLLEDADGMRKAARYVRSILRTQDEDGYLGIYDRELRYAFRSENGELWSKATLYRGLLAYYDCTLDESVFEAVVRAVDNVMRHYPIHASSPFSSGTSFNGGVSHGLMFTDVLERLFALTGNPIYRDYALFLYLDYSNTPQSEADAQLGNILDPEYRLQSHGVHTFEHLRAVIIAREASPDPDLARALDIQVDRIRAATTISGGAIGDEWIHGRHADATHTGYEYCSLHELLDSHALLLQKSGDVHVADDIERIFFNAAQGARHPHRSGIAYLKTDNSYDMRGTRNGEDEPDRIQTRYKYSPAHQDVAVCCAPNAGRISPYFVQNAWMRQNETTLVATLLMPCVLDATLDGHPIRIETITEYPFANGFRWVIRQSAAAGFTLKIRKPDWVDEVACSEAFVLDGGYIRIERTFSAKDEIRLEFKTQVRIRTDPSGSTYFTHGALLYALPIEAREIKGRRYAPDFEDLEYEPGAAARYAADPGAPATYREGRIETSLINQATGKAERVSLVPFGTTILRQVTF